MLSDGSILKYTTAPFSASRRDATPLARLQPVQKCRGYF